MLRLASALFCVIAGAVLYGAIHVHVVADAELRVPDRDAAVRLLDPEG